MSLRRMDIKSVVIGGGPVASLVVLCPQERKTGEGAIKLPIRIGTVEASAISMGVERPEGGRPMTHDLLVNAVVALGGKVASVRVTSVSGTTFYAQVELVAADGSHEYLDARRRPSSCACAASRATWRSTSRPTRGRSFSSTPKGNCPRASRARLTPSW